MTEADMLKYYAKRASLYDKEAKWIAKDIELLKLHRRAAGNSRFQKVLDVATGTGIIGSLFGARAGEVVGIDISKSMLKHARGRIGNLIIGTGESLPFLDNSFDLVLCRQGLHYMNPRVTLREFYRVCNGRILISQIVCFKKTDSKWWWQVFRALSPGRKHVFTGDSLRRLIESAGFSEISCLTFTTRNSVGDWSKSLANKTERTRLLRGFHDAPHAIKELYNFNFTEDDCLYDEPWVIYTGHKN